MWKDILKNDKEDLEIQLEELVSKWGEELDVSDFEYFADRNGPFLSGIEISVTFEDLSEEYDEDGNQTGSQEEKFEDDKGYYLINFASEKYEEFAVADYTYNNGYEVHEFFPERLDVNELKSAIKALGGSVMDDKFRGLGDFLGKADASVEVKMNKAISDIRSMMQPFHEAGFLDYDEHIMAFTDITDKIMNRMLANETNLK